VADVLILVESPNKCAHVQEYAEAAGLNSVQVIGTAGHLYDLPPMGKELGLIPETWEPTEWVPSGRDDADRARKQETINRIKKAAEGSNRVIVATDDDREGEGIASQVWRIVPKGKATRVIFKEITPAGVKAGLAASASDLNWNLVAAQQARRALDRIAGHYGTKLVKQKLGRGSAGRVQSVTTRLVVDRTRAFDAFQPVDTFGVFARLRAEGKEFTARVADKDGNPLTFPTKSEADALTLESNASVLAVISEERDVKPKPPFTASTWLQVAGKGLKWPVAKATTAIQSLFETGSTTYPRTDSVRVAPEAITWAREEIARRFGSEYVPATPNDFKDRQGAQGAHEAIRPTIPDEKGRKHAAEWSPAFELIQARFLASQASAQRISNTTATIDAGTYNLIAKGKVELFPGWKKVLSLDAEEETESKGEATEEDEDKSGLPPLSEGMQCEILGLEVKTFRTKPQPLFTEPALVAELERRGVGRPSTFNKMVTTIVTKGYVIECDPPTKTKSKKGEEGLKFLRPSDEGYSLTDFLAKAIQVLVDPTWTGRIEEGLDKIENGSLPKITFLNKVNEGIQSCLEGAKSIPNAPRERKIFGPCPKCLAEGREGMLQLIIGAKADKTKYEFAGCSLDTRESQPCGYRAQTQNGELWLRKILGPCPKCAAEGRNGILELVSGTRADNSKYEFAGCSLDTKDSKPCGYMGDTLNGELRKPELCQTCKKPMKLKHKKDGTFSLVCDEHGWFTADKNGKIVTPPKCPKCSKPMKFAKRKDTEDHFYGCFDCHEFMDADKWGKVQKASPKKAAK